MKSSFSLLFFALCIFNVLNAQRVQQPKQNTPVKPVLVDIAPVSNRVSYSTSGRDSLRVELVNVDMPGLEIISCTNCTVDASWIKQGGKVEVVVKNNGSTKSNTATVWIQYGTLQLDILKKGFKTVYASDRQGVPALDPGQTFKLNFTVLFSTADAAYYKSKMVRVSLTKSGGSAWRERNQ